MEEVDKYSYCRTAVAYGCNEAIEIIEKFLRGEI